MTFLFVVYLIVTRFAIFFKGFAENPAQNSAKIDRPDGLWYNKSAGNSGRFVRKEVCAVDLLSFVLSVVASVVANYISKWLDRD